jgi:hypothetical protein
LEATAQSQEQGAEDAGREKALSPSIAQNKTDIEKEIIHLTSSGGPPPESSRHVSLLKISN